MYKKNDICNIDYWTETKPERVQLYLKNEKEAFLLG